MKLLTRTVRDYVIFSAVLLLVCTPLFYISIQTLTVRDKDNELRSHKAEFYELIPHLKTDDDLKLFSVMNDEFVLTKTDHPVLRDSIFSSSILINDEDHPFRVLRSGVTINRNHYILKVQESMLTTTDLVSAIVTVQIFLIAFLLAGFVLINRKLSKTIWNPFYIILDRLKKYQIDKDTTIDLPRSSTAEFRDLSLAISQLVIRNHETFQSQKEFTENASHELQTPLAISRTKLELLAQTKELTQEQAELVESLFDAIDRLSHLNKNLLLLSKIENRQFFETEQIDVRSVVTKCADVYKRQVAEKNISIHYSVAEAVFIQVNPILFEVLITNLISNAFRYADEFSTVTVDYSKNHITVCNAGPPLECPEKIFQRFHRESRTTMGHGLGLSIVKKVCEVAGFNINYSYTSDRHQFKVVFPSAES